VLKCRRRIYGFKPSPSFWKYTGRKEVFSFTILNLTNRGDINQSWGPVVLYNLIRNASISPD
jgi:hypothetical protein